jgi:hypothetical protein
MSGTLRASTFIFLHTGIKIPEKQQTIEVSIEMA